MRVSRICHVVELHECPPYAALRCTLADEVSAEPRGRVQGSAILPHLVLSSMRTVAAVVALVACVHAGFWALLRDDARAPNFGGQLASVSTRPSKVQRIRTPARLRALHRFVPISNCWLR